MMKNNDPVNFMNLLVLPLDSQSKELFLFQISIIQPLSETQLLSQAIAEGKTKAKDPIAKINNSLTLRSYKKEIHVVIN